MSSLATAEGFKADKTVMGEKVTNNFQLVNSRTKKIIK
jgi:hypothetical protein